VKTDVVTHPVLADLITSIRDRRTPPEHFAALVHRATTVLLVSATDELTTSPVTINTPLAAAEGNVVVTPPLLLPVLRAGLSMLDAARALLPQSPVGFVGLRRNEDTASASWYLHSLPAQLTDVPVIILEPMVATGGTLTQVITEVRQHGAQHITIVSLICSEPGLTVLRDHPEADCVRVVTAAVDAELNAEHFITPGLGDAGDRAFGWP
jgi:uracil phosphoribosyltransferase